MTAEIENLLLEHLRAIRADVGELRREVRDAKVGLESLESQMAQMYKGIAFVHEDSLPWMDAWKVWTTACSVWSAGWTCGRVRSAAQLLAGTLCWP